MEYQGQKFKTKKDLHQFLVKNKAELISMKKSKRKHTDSYTLKKTSPTDKSLNAINKASILESERSEVVFIGNTYNWVDTYYDVHLDNSFAKSIADTGPQGTNRIWHLRDHNYELTAKVGQFTDIQELDYSWRSLGVDRSGSTQALTLTSNLVREWSERIFCAYRTGEIDQHSVGMQYVRLGLAINDPEYVVEYELWNRYFPLLGNPEVAEELGFFYPVFEARLFETSCVLEGANSLTPVIEAQIFKPEEEAQFKPDEENQFKPDEDKAAPEQSTQHEPEKSTRKTLSHLINQFGESH